MPIDNFWDDVWNQRISLVNIIHANQENRRTVFITRHPLCTHQSLSHPHKGFRGSNKGRSTHVFLKVQFWFLNHILKWKDYQEHPIGFAPFFPRGDILGYFYNTNSLNEKTPHIIRKEVLKDRLVFLGKVYRIIFFWPAYQKMGSCNRFTISYWHQHQYPKKRCTNRKNIW